MSCVAGPWTPAPSFSYIEQLYPISRFALRPAHRA